MLTTLLKATARERWRKTTWPELLGSLLGLIALVAFAVMGGTVCAPVLMFLDGERGVLAVAALTSLVLLIGAVGNHANCRLRDKKLGLLSPGRDTLMACSGLPISRARLFLSVALVTAACDFNVWVALGCPLLAAAVALREEGWRMLLALPLLAPTAVVFHLVLLLADGALCRRASPAALRCLPLIGGSVILICSLGLGSIAGGAAGAWGWRAGVSLWDGSAWLRWATEGWPLVQVVEAVRATSQAPVSAALHLLAAELPSLLLLVILPVAAERGLARGHLALLPGAAEGRPAARSKAAVELRIPARSGWGREDALVAAVLLGVWAVLAIVFLIADRNAGPLLLVGTSVFSAALAAVLVGQEVLPRLALCLPRPASHWMRIEIGHGAAGALVLGLPPFLLTQGWRSPIDLAGAWALAVLGSVFGAVAGLSVAASLAVPLGRQPAHWRQLAGLLLVLASLLPVWALYWARFAPAASIALVAMAWVLSRLWRAACHRMRWPEDPLPPPRVGGSRDWTVLAFLAVLLLGCTP